MALLEVWAARVVSMAAGIWRYSGAASLRRALALSFSLSDFSWPQAARMSRPRGVRMGEA